MGGGGVMKVENLVPRVGIEPTLLAFQASVLTITPPRLFYVTLLPIPTTLCSSFDCEVSADYYTRPPGIVSLLTLTITYIQAVYFCIHTQGRFNNYIVCAVYRIMVTAKSVLGVMARDKIEPRAGFRTRVSCIPGRCSNH